MTGRMWVPGQAEPAGMVRAFLEGADPQGVFANALTVSFGSGMWFLLDDDGQVTTTTWATLLSVADAVVEFFDDARCRHAWNSPSQWETLFLQGSPPYRCVWPEHGHGFHLIDGLAWCSGVADEVVLDA